ncbi:MAG: c-type cytochrome [Deltaproteobacteria bacterium]|nr:c-type cytochrome [Deltaproteobacteria bacterium]
MEVREKALKTRRFGIKVHAITLFVFFTVLLASSAMAHSKAFQGRKLFVTYCYLCHGTSGKGDGPLSSKLKVPPADLTDNARVGKRTDVELFGIIQGGKHDLVTKDMPKWGKVILGPQIEALVAYVRFLSLSKNPLIGDAEVGEHIYLDYCTSCHGEKGKGDGIMMSIVPIKAADHTNAERMDKMTNEELVRIVTNGKDAGSFMPGWKGILSQSEIEAVVSYMRFLSH